MFPPRLAVARVGDMERRRNTASIAAVLPGDPLITGTLSQGVMNGISIYSNILLARFALSWFPQLLQQFRFLRPIILVTDPYLKIFRSVIPPIAGFDISALPALFLLDIFSQTTAAIGAELPERLAKTVYKFKKYDVKSRRQKA